MSQKGKILLKTNCPNSLIKRKVVNEIKISEAKKHVKIGKLTPLHYVKRNAQGGQIWLFRCDCGNDKELTIGHVGDSTHSCNKCGVLQKDFGDGNKNSPYYKLKRVWKDMRKRCNNYNDTAYHYYGGRGIKVCDEWNNSYSAFKKWALDNGYNPKLGRKEQSIDRIDVDGNYRPENCRWVDWKTQVRNRRNTRWVDFRGDKVLLVDLAEKYGISPKTMQDRYYAGGKRGEDLIKPVLHKYVD